MLLFDRRNFLISLAALPLAACGFTPVYKANGAARDLQGAIRFNLIESNEGFALLEQLELHLGTPGPAYKYNAHVELMILEEQLVLTAATAVIRNTLTGIAKIRVTSAATGNQLFSDSLRETAGYTSNAETLTTATSRRDAHDRLVRALADKIALRLASTAESWVE